MIEVVDFSKTNSVINLYMSELRDKNYQKNRLLFRHNIKRVGEMMAYELSKTLEYRPKTITTPLGTIDIQLPKEDLLIATVLRAGLPFHEGFINVFDHADNAFVSAYRMYTNREHTEVGVHTEYLAAPSAKGKTLVIVDPMPAVALRCGLIGRCLRHGLGCDLNCFIALVGYGNVLSCKHRRGVLKQHRYHR